jgi:DNA invertase Pin-like site-specific DNA recombinase
MTQYQLEPRLAPRNGHRLKILAVCRISTLNQDERSLEDQEALYRNWLTRHTDLPFDITVIASQGSGECLDRTEYLRAIELVESAELDLVITEDLGRICRRVHAHIFCELCEDFQTRLIALNDHVDTEREDWRLGSFFAVMRHETYNRDTSQRIRRSLRNRFQQGEAFQFPIAGYIKPKKQSKDDKVHDSQVAKDPAAEAVYDEWFTRLEQGATFAEVADWLNAIGFPTGPYHRNKVWDGRMVARVTHNPILKGVRVRNERMSQRVNRTGRRKSIKAPEMERLERACPHLAFIEPERYDRVIRLLKLRNSKYRRRGQAGRDTRANVPKKRTRWPGQHIYCGICGRLFVFGGHGQKDHLMCSGAREYKCWNAITVDGPLAACKLSKAVFDRIVDLPDFDAEFTDILREQWQRLNDQSRTRLREVSRQVERMDREVANLVRAVRNSGGSPSLLQELQRLEEERSSLLVERDAAERTPRPTMDLPSMDEIKRLAHESFEGLSAESPEFGRKMKRLIPRIVVFPYRLIDGGQIVLRARFRLDLSFYACGLDHSGGVFSPLRGELLVDLFNPPQRARYRDQVALLRADGLTERRAAEQLGITTTAAQRASVLSRLMRDRSLTDPYVQVSEPPEDFTKLRRHKHKRYVFEPLEQAGEL